MATSIHTASKSKLRKSKQENIKITAAVHLRGYEILVLFSNDRMKVIDFSEAIKKFAKGDYSLYSQAKHFKKFSVENGNIIWGKNWDLIFPVNNIFHASF
ncbi:MAG: DUF2442 domain-containing protein [Bacteroidetes bacterium]|nr:DUF2442 domain-containing protein [Bacteroidota bacterium]